VPFFLLPTVSVFAANPKGGCRHLFMGTVALSRMNRASRKIHSYGLAMIFAIAPNLCTARNETAQAPTAKPSASVRQNAPQTLNGEWSGTLTAGETQLHLVLHLTKQAGGSWRASLDSVDQAVYGMEAATAAVTNDSVSFDLPAVGAHFEGKVQPDRRSVRGLWQQNGVTLPLRFEKRAPGAGSRVEAAVNKVEGTWQGAIETGNMRVRLQLHIAHDERGQLAVALDSLDQGVNGIPATHVSERAGAFKFEIPAFNADYTGNFNAANTELKGQWTQNDNVEPLIFLRSDQVLALRRPQNPQKPYPYREEMVSFAAANGAVTLAGTLTLPPGDGPFAAAVLAGGSGPNDRDETTAGHKLFLVLADYLTRRGVAVLRYDKRGIAQSSGDFATAGLQDFAGDAASALNFLKSRKEVDAQRLGVIGHGEGAILAALAAKNTADVKWLALLGAPATSGERALLRQSELVARAGGLGEEQITQSLTFDRKAYAVVRGEKNAETAQRQLQALVEQSGLSPSMPPAAVQAQLHMMTSPWFREYLDYDPLPDLEKLKCPVLALAGDRDLQVDSLENVPLLKKAYEASGNQDFTVVEMEGLNHLLQTAQSGSPALYGAIEETIAPDALAAIGNWIAEHTSPTSASDPKK
jgi:pimeloyl-ACP methyl ester carboxylesterase